MVRNGNPELPACYFAVARQLISDIACHVDGYRKANPDIAARWTDNCGIDTDQPAVDVNQRVRALQYAAVWTA